MHAFTELLLLLFDRVRLWIDSLTDEVPGASLAVTRIVFGLLMLADLQEERGMPLLDERFGDFRECRFPLFESIRPLRVELMILLYALMMLALLCVVIGFAYRRALFVYSAIYWYIFISDKTRWNNHSYLYGLISIILLTSSADRCLSWKSPSIWNTVPRWNYLFIRLQIFLVYFYAGVKKLDFDWLGGFSMRGLGHHWVWSPLTLFLPVGVIEHFVIHILGFLFDLVVGFLLLWRPTRKLGSLLTVAFNGLNSRMFSIGMFPYVMIALLPLFFDYDWPLKLRLSSQPSEQRAQTSSSSGSGSNAQRGKNKVSLCVKMFIGTFILVQVTLPFVSTKLLPGFDTWTGGLYGHQWNMMVHNWNHGQIQFTVKDKLTGDTMYIDHKQFTKRGRWYQQADMVCQFARCVQQRLRDELNLTHTEIYADVWMSLNSRFMQRIFDPRVDLTTVEWSPFERPSWIFEVHRDVDHLRPIIMNTASIQARSIKGSHADFLLDFPDLQFTNYISSELEGVYLTLLKGKATLTIANDEQLLLTEGKRVMIPSGSSHVVSNVGEEISLLMYVYVNRTENVSLQPANFTTSSVLRNFGRQHFNMWIDSFRLVDWALRKLFTDATGIVLPTSSLWS